MSTDLEMLLRSTLAGRAETVTYGPQWTGADSLRVSPGPNRNRRWLAVAAAAAAVVLVGAGVVALRNAHNGSTPPASPSPSISVPTPTGHPSPTTSATRTAPTPTKVTQLASCPTTLPSAWTDAMQNSVVDLGGRTVTPLAVAPDRSIVALRDDGVQPGSAREVVYAPPGSPASVVYTIKDPDHTSVQFGAVSGPWLVLGLWNNPRPPKNTIPGSSTIGLQGIVVVNLEDLSTKLIAGIDTALTQGYSGPTTRAAAVSDGVVYWDEEKQFSDTTGKLKSYNLSTGKTKDVYTGAIGNLVATAAGVGWPDFTTGSFVFVVRNHLPSVVENAMTDFSRSRLQTDGTSYAWINSSKDVYWWQPGLAEPVHLRLPTGRSIPTDTFIGYVSVSGHMLISDNSSPMVIDMQTGAVAPFPTDGLFGNARGTLLGNTGSVFYGYAFTGTAGHYENGYWADTATSALSFDVSGLPDLTC